jgi:NarL family two-component system response regulator LiaR
MRLVSTPLRLAIVNDYEVVVRGLGDMLAPFSDEIVIVELDSTVQVTQPVDIALYDTFAQTQGDGPDVVDLLANPLVAKVVVYSWNIENRLIEGTLARGASAYLSKTLSAAELVDALRRVHAGEQIISPDPGDAPLVGGDWPGREQGLTAREAEVVALITQGFSNAEIADRASLSINSVKTYIRSSYRKMGVSSRTNAVLWGLEHGFTPDRVRITPASTRA